MAGKSRRSKLVLSDQDRAELEQLTRSRTAPQRETQRAAILLGYHAGESIAAIGRRLGMTRLSISKWVSKALAVGPMAALKDSYHRPKEPVIGDDAKAWVVHVACSKPKDLGMRPRSGAGRLWQSISASTPWRPVTPLCRGRPKRPCNESWPNNRFIPRRLSTTWSGAILTSRRECGKS